MSGPEDGEDVLCGVASGCAVLVDPGGWDEFGGAVGGPADLPVAMVDLGMMEWAEEAAIVVAGGAAVGPVDNMMDVGPAGRSVAAGPAAALVPQGDGPGERRERGRRGDDRVVDQGFLHQGPGVRVD